MLLGGITAEKLYVGDISTGASNDLKRATDIARRMVSEWGMSSEVGMVYCGSDSEVFIGKSYQERMPYSENQAALIDEEIKKIIDFCAKETERILTENKDKLLTMANVLLEKETIYAEEVDMIIDGKSKEEVIAYIDSKDKKDEENKKPENKVEEKVNASEETKTEKSSEVQKTAEDLINNLIKIAENREKEQENKEKTEENNKKSAKNTENSSKNSAKSSKKASSSKTSATKKSGQTTTKKKTASSDVTKKKSTNKSRAKTQDVSQETNKTDIDN